MIAELADRRPKLMRNQEAMLAILRKSKEVGLPKYYRTDISVHDRSRIGAMPEGLVFLWLVRETGTWLILPPWKTGQSTSEWWWRGDGSILRYSIRHEPHRAFLWDGRSLDEVPLDQAEDKLLALDPSKS